MTNVSPMQLMVSIVERGKGTGLMAHYKNYKVSTTVRPPAGGLPPPMCWIRWASAPPSGTSS